METRGRGRLPFVLEPEVDAASHEIGILRVISQKAGAVVLERGLFVEDIQAAQ